jgi:hypothetical protein
MPRGGKRAGAGRPRTKDTPAGKLNAELVLRALKEGTTPLDVMLEAMKEAYEEGGALKAMPYAKEAAPYMHPKLTSVDATLSGQVGQYQAQPVPVEEREPHPKLNGHAH